MVLTVILRAQFRGFFARRGEKASLNFVCDFPEGKKTRVSRGYRDISGIIDSRELYCLNCDSALYLEFLVKLAKCHEPMLVGLNALIM